MIKSRNFCRNLDILSVFFSFFSIFIKFLHFSAIYIIFYQNILVSINFLYFLVVDKNKMILLIFY